MLVLVLAAGLLVLAPPGAEAGTAQCSGQWRMPTGANYQYPVVGPSRTSSFVMNFVAGVCAPAFHNADATGTMTGFCHNAGGSGTMGGHHSFTFVWSGGTMTFTGNVTGTLAVLVNPNTGDSCQSGADDFILSGTLTLH